MILDELEEARGSVQRGKLQAVVLSAPTGSGKTITVASVIDQTFGGGDDVIARPETTFLWLSDSPELNAQSKAKLLNACDNIPFHRMITIDSENFDEERLHAGFVYFINTQLLGRDKRLTQDGDDRSFTFWETVANTVNEAPQRFVLIIDEAHRGAGIADRNRTPIMQKFILGSEQDNLPPVPIVLGMSATPQRFTHLLGNANRTQRPVNITPEQVRSSGLLKDMIIVHNPRTRAATDLTLLEQAAQGIKRFSSLWETYCRKEGEDLIRPILVVQVEDGTEHSITRSPLSEAVRAIERQLGVLNPNELVHCFQEHADIEAGGRIIRKMEASRVQESQDVRAVFFKTALSTGWDCPRAEIMMSFRRAQDPTSIAQLVGRMIRTPLARRIAEDEVLDTVELFLPHYDAETLESVLVRLRNPEAEESVPTRVEVSVQEYGRNSEFRHIFESLSALPTYSISRVPKMGELKRTLRLAGMLVQEGIDIDADEYVRQLFTTKLKEIRDHLAATDPGWEGVVREGGEIDVDVSMVAIGEMSVIGKNVIRLTLSDENIERLFEAAGRKLASGEGLHRSYWKRFHEHDKPNKAKLELFAMVRSPFTTLQLDKIAIEQFSSLWSKNKQAIKRLPASERLSFTNLQQASGTPVQQDWELPEKIVEKADGVKWKSHLFCDAKGDFVAALNNWEKLILEEAVEEPGFVCWLRNIPRRDWALCIPYELNGAKPFYPDFVVIRSVAGDLIVDIIEPHDHTRSDTWAKVKGLADFADKHGVQFGRLIIARKQGEAFERIDLNDNITRRKARAMQSQSDIESLFH